MTQQIQELAKTLLASKLAASASEAQRMAEDMLGVAKKVTADDNKDHIYAVSGYGKKQHSQEKPPLQQPFQNPDTSQVPQSEQEPIKTTSNDDSASQQANMLATESMQESTVPRPEDTFAKQFEGKNLSDLSEENKQDDFIGASSSIEAGWPQENSETTDSEPEKTQEVPAEKKSSGFSEEEKKLQKEVDISKVFNFSK